MTRERVYPRELTCWSVRVRGYQRRISWVPPPRDRRRRGFACRPCSHRCEAADPKHLGARIGATAVLHSWGSAMTHHPREAGPADGGTEGSNPLSSTGESFLPQAARPVRGSDRGQGLARTPALSKANPGTRGARPPGGKNMKTLLSKALNELVGSNTRHSSARCASSRTCSKPPRG